MKESFLITENDEIDLGSGKWLQNHQIDSFAEDVEVLLACAED